MNTHYTNSTAPQSSSKPPADPLAFPTAAEYAISGTLRKRKSSCSANCGSKDGGKDGGCSSCSRPVLPENVLGSLVEIEFKGRRRGFYKRPKNLDILLGDHVVVEAERGVDIGTVSAFGTDAVRKLKRAASESPVFQLVRHASPEELATLQANRAAEQEALAVCRSRAEFFQLDMKVIDAEWQFDHQRLSFFFTSPKQVDFRELVRDLAGIFSTRIELRHISAREEARRVGGLGVCGLELCCSTFLSKFEYITIDHARIQNLNNNNNKLSGQCGRLKCCLLYEVDTYVEALQKFPPLHSRLRLPEGEFYILKIDIFSETMVIKSQDGAHVKELSLQDIHQLQESKALIIPDEDKAMPRRRKPERPAGLSDDHDIVEEF